MLSLFESRNLIFQRTFTLSRCAIVVLALALSTTKGHADDFLFQAPSGWKEVPHALQVSGGAYSWAAILDEKDASSGNVNAIIIDGQLEIGEQFISAASALMTERVNKIAGASYLPISAKVRDFGGVNVGEIVGNFAVGDKSGRQIAYYLPGKTKSAVLTYTVPENTFTSIYPQILKSAVATRGLFQDSRRMRSPSSRALDKGIVGAFSGLLVCLFAWIAAKTRFSSSDRQPSVVESKTSVDGGDLIGPTDIRADCSQAANPKHSIRPSAIAAPGMRKALAGWWRKQSRLFRQWVFFSSVWMAIVPLYVAWFNPYHHYHMRSGDWFHMYTLMIIPPLFIWGAKLAYDHWVA